MPGFRHIRSTITLLVLLVLACRDAPKAAPAEATTEAPALAAATADRPMLLVFSRDYCTPCQVMKPWVAEVAAEAPSVDVVTLNVDRKKHESLGGFFKISAVPTLIYIQADGQVARRTDGLAKKPQMMKALRKLGWAP